MEQIAETPDEEEEEEEEEEGKLLWKCHYKALGAGILYTVLFQLGTVYSYIICFVFPL